MSDSINGKQRLGKGLESLIPKTTLVSGRTISHIPLSSIKPNPYQPRHHFDQTSLDSLANSIKQHGLAQPIIVRKKDDYYELIAGERRYRASLIAQQEFIPAIIKNVSDKDALQLALIENIEREDLNCIEIAKGYLRLIDEFELTHQALSEIFGKSRSAITNTIRLLKLPQKIQDAIENGEISEGHARTLITLEDEMKILEQYERIKNEQLNVRQIEETVSRAKKKHSSADDQDTQMVLFAGIEKDLSVKYQTPIKVKGSESKGRIVIQYKSYEQLRDLYAKLSNVLV